MTSKDKGKWLVVPRGQAWGCFLCGKVVDRRSRSSHVPFLLLLRAPREKRQSFFGRFVKQEDSPSSGLEKQILEYNRSLLYHLLSNKSRGRSQYRMVEKPDRAGNKPSVTSAPK